MTRMLASVTDGAEAEIAVAGGADIIDIKDPAKGALGALPPLEVAAIVAAIAGRRPSSAVTGDLPMQPALVLAAAQAMAASGVGYVKIGIFPDAAAADCIRALAPLARATALVGVMFADLELDLALLPLMAQCGFAGAMLDTARKGGAGRLTDRRDFAFIGDFARACREHGLLCGLAGSLEAPDIPRLLAAGPDFLGFRGALCAGHERRASIDAGALAMIRALIPRAAPAPETAPKVDWRLLSARGYSRDGGAGATDKVFVRDLVLPMHIGAYGYERVHAQKVRFNVEAQVARAAAAGDDMRGVFSYDVIRDAIGAILQRGHIAMVETIAEEVAQAVLRHERVVDVMVRVEKLEIIDGSLGVEIRRGRVAANATVAELFADARRG